MTETIKLLLLALMLLPAMAFAASWEEILPRCSTECPFSGEPKLKYDLGKIYSYSYSVKSEVLVQPWNKTGSLWSSTLEMTWITPCDMAIKFNNSNIKGSEGPAAAESLERYPLVVAITDGRVQHVCSHPDDDVWAVNLKKGVASAIQNSLPSLSATDSPLTLLETDVVGKCPTLYETEIEESKITVRKVKKHKDCQNHFSSFTELSMIWMLASASIQNSNCQQEITSGLYTTIVCEDKKTFQFLFGNTRHMQAYQDSRLQLQSESSSSSSHSPSNNQTEMVQDNLLYDHAVKRDPSLVAQLDAIMGIICRDTKGDFKYYVGHLVSMTMHLMRLVPEAAVEQTLEKIRSGHFCKDYRRLESIFLDSVAFSLDSSAVEVLVKELISGDTTEDRAFLYAHSLCFISRPNTFAIEALKPLMEASQSLSTATLCGASMINEFCQNNHQCQEEEPVRSIANVLSNRLEEQCSSLHDEETRTATLVTLKAVGNMGVISPEVSSSIISCMESQEIDTGVRVAAVQSFRNAECRHFPTEKLTNFVMNSSVNTEVRIASYLAVIRCAGERDLQMIISEMLHETNIQVRGFILSHLVNLRKSDISYKEPLKHLLSNMIFPDDFEVDIMKISRNVGMSFSAPSLGMKADIESNIVHTPESHVPRNLNINVTTDYLETSMNMVEVGARLEGIEPFLEVVSEAKDHDFESDKREPLTDAFVRILGKEIYFTSESDDPRYIFIDNIIRYFSKYADLIIGRLLRGRDSARVMHYWEDYFIPTIQGSVFKYELESTAVIGLNLSGILHFLQNPRDPENILKIQPSLSLMTNVFFGYDSHLVKEGIYVSSTIVSNNTFSVNVHMNNYDELTIQLDIPDTVEGINMVVEVLLMTKFIGSQDFARSPQLKSDDPTYSVSCFKDLEYYIGLGFCYDDDFYVITRIDESDIPFGMAYAINVFIKKFDSSVTAYSLKFSPNYIHSSGHGPKVQAKVVGSRRQREMTIYVSYSYEDELKKIALLFDTALNGKGGVWLSLRNHKDQTTIEGNVKFGNNHYGMKIDLIERMKTPEELEYKLKAYLSLPYNHLQNLQFLEGKLNMRTNDPETTLDLNLRSLDYFNRNFFKFSLEAGVDLVRTQYRHINVPSRIREFDIYMENGGWYAESYIRKMNESAYETLFIINRRRRGVLLAVRGTHITEGNWRQDDDAALNTSVTVTYRGDPIFEVSNEIFYGINHTGMAIEVLRSHDSYTLAEFIVFL